MKNNIFYTVVKDEKPQRYYMSFNKAQIFADEIGGSVVVLSFDDDENDDDLDYKIYIFDFNYSDSSEDKAYICYCTKDEYKELNDGEIKENENSYEVWLKEDDVEKAEGILGKYLVEKRKNEQ